MQITSPLCCSVPLTLKWGNNQTYLPGLWYEMHIMGWAQFGVDDNWLPSPSSHSSCIVSLSPALLMTVKSSHFCLFSGALICPFLLPLCLVRSFCSQTIAIGAKLVSLNAISPIFSLSHSTTCHSTELNVYLHLQGLSLPCAPSLPLQPNSYLCSPGIPDSD